MCQHQLKEIIYRNKNEYAISLVLPLKKLTYLPTSMPTSKIPKSASPARKEDIAKRCLEAIVAYHAPRILTTNQS